MNDGTKERTKKQGQGRKKERGKEVKMARGKEGTRKGGKKARRKEENNGSELNLGAFKIYFAVTLVAFRVYEGGFGSLFGHFRRRK